jgi:F420-dependent oxidoreductase-like protein
MRISVPLSYAVEPLSQVPLVVEMEQAGLDAVWVAETWGYDAPTFMGYLAASTRSIAIGAGVLSVYSRTPALIAQTAAGVDALSGGRCILGLGTSGAQVVEGFHGVPFDRPMTRLRECVDICRLVWRREPVRYDGAAYQLPLPDGRGTGLGKPLKMITRPARDRIPIYLASLRPKAVELTAEVAEGWYPIFFVAEAADAVWGPALAAGAARRPPDLPPLEICAGGICAVGEGPEVEALRDLARAELALYIGGMGSRGRNYYTELFARFGWEEAAAEVQDLFLAGDRDAAQARLPADLVESATLCGPASYIRERIGRLQEAGVTMLNVRPVGPDPVATIAALRDLTG